MRSWKLEFETLLEQLGSLLSEAGFRTYVRDQSFRRKTKIGIDIFHIQRSRHFDGMNISADVAIRCDAIEDFLYELYRGVVRSPKLGPEVRKGMATLGTGVSDLVPQGRFQMWPVRNVDDAESVAKALFESYVKIAQPHFFSIYTSLDMIFGALTDDAQHLSIGGYSTARKTVVAAMLMRVDGSDLNALVRSQAQALARSAKSDLQVGEFAEFLSRLRDKHPELKLQNPFLHS